MRAELKSRVRAASGRSYNRELTRQPLKYMETRRRPRLRAEYPACGRGFAPQAGAPTTEGTRADPRNTWERVGGSACGPNHGMRWWGSRRKRTRLRHGPLGVLQFRQAAPVFAFLDQGAGFGEFITVAEQAGAGEVKVGEMQTHVATASDAFHFV